MLLRILFPWAFPVLGISVRLFIRIYNDPQHFLSEDDFVGDLFLGFLSYTQLQKFFLISRGTKSRKSGLVPNFQDF
jgi:hypothetical protein